MFKILSFGVISLILFMYIAYAQNNLFDNYSSEIKQNEQIQVNFTEEETSTQEAFSDTEIIILNNDETEIVEKD